ncbi:MAG: hypothetical protein IPK91_02095 [Saprospiraceae bacterium]|nr:hypothetical protein [Saprospiraceae bacterium]
MGLLNKLFGNEKQRSASFQVLANQLNLKYEPQNEFGLIKQLSDFGLFKIGSSQKISNVLIEKTFDSENYLFDYQYVVSTGKSAVRFEQTVFFVNSKQLSLPQFVQKPETFFTKLMAYLGFDDIDFVKFPEYSDKFHLKGEYEEVIRFYFSEELLQLLSDQKSFNMEAMNYYFILYHQNKLIHTSELKAFRNLGMMLYNLFLIQSKKSDNFLLP